MTTQKHIKFIESPMGDKLVTEVAGIGPQLAERMKDKEIVQATDLYGRFLTMKKDKEKFQKWMKDSFGANAKQSGDCYQALYDWSYNFLY